MEKNTEMKCLKCNGDGALRVVCGTCLGDGRTNRWQLSEDFQDLPVQTVMAQEKSAQTLIAHSVMVQAKLN